MKYKIDIEELISLRKKGMNFTLIAKHFGISRTSIAYYFKKIGINNSKPDNYYRKSTKYKYNENYFEIIDSEDKAYFLGLFYADGCNHKVKVGGRISIGLDKKDEYLLLKFKESIKYSGNLICSRNLKVLYINDKKLATDLIKNGAGIRKSYHLTFPDNGIIPDELMNHFIRGYFDGDGCFYTVKGNGKKQMNYTRGSLFICGHELFCKGFCSFLEQLGIYSNCYKTKNMYRCFIYRKESLKRFFSYLYYNSSIKMVRKYEKYKNYINSII